MRDRNPVLRDGAMMNQKRKERRSIKLVKPRLQLRLIGIFVGLSALGFLLQALHVALRLSELSGTMPEGGSHLMAVLPELPIEILVFSFGMILPLITAVGIFITHRIAGPVYRFEQHLGQVARGEDPGPCRLRRGDELQDLCEVLNQALEVWRRGQAIAPGPPAAADPTPAKRAG
ncbi:MAG: hypothetical protein AB1726_05230 [Planctomycetota bacterium]